MSFCYTGTDEAGMGPLLGPLAIAQCRVTSETACDVAEIFSARKIPVADSKKIYSSGKLAKLEAVALPCARWFSGWEIENAAELFALFQEDPQLRADVPWMAGAESLQLPFAANNPDLATWSIPELQPAGFSGRLLHPRHINHSYRQGVNKLSLEIASILDLVAATTPACSTYDHAVDRLGGRAYYSELLGERFQTSINTISEVKGVSNYSFVYHDASHELGFWVKGEDKNPLIAAASCLAKYARELHMVLLNGYWTQRLNWLKHTAGYPQDAKRWLFQLGAGTVNAHQDELVRGEVPQIFTVS